MTNKKDIIDIFCDQKYYPIFNDWEYNPTSYITIDLNYATVTIQHVSKTAQDRGKCSVLASHKTGFQDKCYIDSADGFPRYYFSYTCMVTELDSWIKARKLEINDITLVKE